MIAREIDPTAGRHECAGVRGSAEQQIRRARQHHFAELTTANRLRGLLNHLAPARFVREMRFTFLLQGQFSGGVIRAERSQTSAGTFCILL